MTREELVLSVYEHLDYEASATKRTPGLGSDALRKFAELLDFKGSDQEWNYEFHELLDDVHATVHDGIKLKALIKICEDRDSPLFCTTKELQSIVLKLHKGFDVFQAINHLSRYELIWMIFRHLEPQEKKRMSFDNLLIYLQKLGYDSNTFDFEVEYENLSKKYGWLKEDGPSLADFAFMANDDTGPCYCKTEDMKDMLQDMVQSMASLPLMKLSRDTLELKLFIACQPRDTDHLSLNSMRLFASFKGFRGTAAEWLKEYLAMCHDYGWDDRLGVDLAGFKKLLSNEKSGAYCTNADIREILVQLVIVREVIPEDVILKENAGTTLPSAIVAERRRKQQELEEAGLQEQMQKEALKEAKKQKVWRVRQDAQTRIKRILRGRGAHEGVIEHEGNPHDHDLEQRAFEADELKVIKDIQDDDYYHTIKSNNVSEWEASGKQSRSSALMFALIKHDMETLKEEQRKYQIEEQKARAEAAVRLKALMGDTLSEEEKRIHKGSAEDRKKKNKPRPKALTPPQTQKVLSFFQIGAKKIPQTDELILRLQNYWDNTKRMEDSQVTDAVRKVWNISRSDVPDQLIGALCSTLDPENTGKIEARRLLEFAIGKALTAEQLTQLKATQGIGDPSEPATDSEHEEAAKASSDGSSSYTEGGSRFVKRERHQLFEDSTLPDAEDLTSKYLGANPGFILRVIYEKRSELCLAALTRITYKGINQTDSRGCTALHLAAEKDLAAVCTALLNRSLFKGPNATDWFNWNALHRGARFGSYNACKALLVHPRFTVMDEAAESGWTALHLAAMHGQAQVCFLLVSDLRFTVQTAQDEWGRTALHCAAEHGHIEAVQALLTYGYSEAEICIQNKWGHTAQGTAKDDLTAKIVKAAQVTRSEEEKAERKESRRDHHSPFSSSRGKLKRDAPSHQIDVPEHSRDRLKVGKVTFARDDESLVSME